MQRKSTAKKTKAHKKAAVKTPVNRPTFGIFHNGEEIARSPDGIHAKDIAAACEECYEGEFTYRRI